MKIKITTSILALSLMLCQGPGSAQTKGPTSDQKAINAYNLGLNAYNMGSPESAIIFFRRATDLNPDLADAHYNLGVLYASEKRYNEASESFQKVLKVKQNDPDASFELGKVYIELGKYDLAKQALMNISPNNDHFVNAQKQIELIDSKLSQTNNNQPLTVETNTAIKQIPNNDQLLNNNSGSLALTSNSQASNPVDHSNTNNNAMNVNNDSSQNSGTNLAKIKVIAKGFNSPSGIAKDNKGNLYVANFQSNTIDRISSDGRRMVFVSNNLNGPLGMACDSQGNIYIANYNSGTVLQIDSTGKQTLIAKDLKNPYYLTLDNNKNLYITEHKSNAVVMLKINEANIELSNQAPLP